MGKPFRGLSAASAPPALRVEILQKRQDFVATARARRCGAANMLVQGRMRPPQAPLPAAVMRVGFTCSRKVGNAVMRNRAKRRLRDAARQVLPLHGRAGWDYVLVGRAALTASCPFGALAGDLVQALQQLHRKPPVRGTRPAKSPTHIAQP